ncbi:hypothetical protein Hanom_Chr00s000004g01609261 [Helianthus anomalus]
MVLILVLLPFLIERLIRWRWFVKMVVIRSRRWWCWWRWLQIVVVTES